MFEGAYPTDDRPRKAIEAARSDASVALARAAALAAHAAARAALADGQVIATHAAHRCGRAHMATQTSSYVAVIEADRTELHSRHKGEEPCSKQRQRSAGFRWTTWRRRRRPTPRPWVYRSIRMG